MRRVHATVGRLLFGLDSGRCGGVSIVDQRSYACIDTRKASPAQAVIVCLAGGSAERLLLAKHNMPVDGDFDKLDKQRVERLAKQHNLTADDVTRLQRKTDALVAEHYPSIRRVAAHLLKYRLVGASEIDRLLKMK